MKCFLLVLINVHCDRLIPGCKNLQQHASSHRNDRNCGDDELGNPVQMSWNLIHFSAAFVEVTWSLLLTYRLGLDPKLLAKILNMSSGRCWSSDTYNPVPGVMEGVPSGNNYQGGFGTQLMAKVSSTSSSLFPISPVVFAWQMLNFWTNCSKYE